VRSGDVLDPYGNTNQASSVLGDEPCPVDSDGDGVVDGEDRCPAEPGPPGNDGCPLPDPVLDGDGDGVPDSADRCPGTLGPINDSGCPAQPGAGPGPQGAPQPGGAKRCRKGAKRKRGRKCARKRVGRPAGA
jgi:Thrombospondin type 3 repeat